MQTRDERTQLRVHYVMEHFAECLDAYDRDPPFPRPAQRDLHRMAIKQRVQLGSAAAALADDDFVRRLRQVLVEWGMAARAAKLRPLAEFQTALRSHGDAVAALDGLAIDSPGLPLDEASRQLFDLIQTLGIVGSKAKIVAGSKALHHLLPELVVPIDRKWTGCFFGWHREEYQGLTGQRRVWSRTFAAYVRIARALPLRSYLTGEPWRTCITKLLDNAVIGYCILHKKPGESSRACD